MIRGLGEGKESTKRQRRNESYTMWVLETKRRKCVKEE